MAIINADHTVWGILRQVGEAFLAARRFCAFPSGALFWVARLDNAAPVFITANHTLMRGPQFLTFAVLLLIDSMHYIFARLLLPRIQPTASAFYVLAIAAVQVLLFAAATRQLHWRAFGRHAVFYLAIGFLVAASTVLSYESIAYVDPGTAALLGKTSTLFAVLLGVLWLRESLTARQVGGTMLALAGAFVIAFQPGDYLRFGALLVLASALLYAVHTALVKRYGETIDFLDFFLFRLLATAGFLLLMSGVRGVLIWPDGWTLALLLLTASVDVVLSRTLYYRTLRTLPMSVHSIILTLSPVVSVVLSAVLFAVRPTLAQLIGGGMVLAGVLLVTRWARRSNPKNVPAVQALPSREETRQDRRSVG